VADTITKLTLTKRFTYRDVSDEEFSNTYEFVGAPPGDFATWHALAMQVWGNEAGCFTTDVQFVHAVGHNNNDPQAQNVYLEDFTSQNIKGQYVNTAGIRGAGDQAACVEFKTDINSTKGKPVYVRKFFHEPYIDPADTDRLHAPYVTALNSYGTAIIDVHGGLGCHSPNQPQRIALQHLVIPWVTTRTLRKRGKKKRPA